MIETATSKPDSREAAWSLTDQAAVSGGNFLTTLVLARLCSAETYGIFSLLYISLYAINTCHSSLVVYPLTLNVAQRKRDECHHLNGVAMVHTLALALPFALVLGAITYFLHRLDLWPWITFAMVGWQVQEAARRTLLAGHRSKDAVAPDAFCFVGQGLILLALHSHDLKLVFAVMGATSLVAAVWQLWIAKVSWQTAFSLEACTYAWGLGRYILMGNVVNMATLQVPSWSLKVLVGTVAVAGYQSLTNLVGVANPIMFSINNLLIPAVARDAWKGPAEARKTMYYYGLRYGALLAPCFIALLVAPAWIMRLVYGAHSPYLGLAVYIRLFVLGYAIQYLVTVLGAYEGGMSRPMTYMWIQIAGAAVLLSAGIYFIYRSGIAGAVLAMVLAGGTRLVALIVLSRAGDRKLINHYQTALAYESGKAGPL